MRLPISTARRRLFELTELARSSDDAVVVIEQRGGGEPVALVRESRLAYLEERLAQLEASPRVPFVLAGSLSSVADDDALERSLRELRHAWTPRPTDGGASARRGRPPGRSRKR